MVEVTEAEIEAVARAMWDAEHLQNWVGPQNPGTIITDFDRDVYRNHARAAIAAMTAARPPVEEGEVTRLREALAVIQRSAMNKGIGDLDFRYTTERRASRALAALRNSTDGEKA